MVAAADMLSLKYWTDEFLANDQKLAFNLDPVLQADLEVEFFNLMNAKMVEMSRLKGGKSMSPLSISVVAEREAMDLLLWDKYHKSPKRPRLCGYGPGDYDDTHKPKTQAQFDKMGRQLLRFDTMYMEYSIPFIGQED